MTEQNKYTAVAYCYRSGQRSLYEKFPELNKYDISWADADADAEDNETEIKGNIYTPFTLMRALKIHPEGYDFVVMDVLLEMHEVNYCTII